MNTMMKTLSWQDILGEEKSKPYFNKIIEFVKAERQLGKKIYPPQNDIFNAIRYTPYENVKVVILGQDPYHGPGQAHGLAFSVLPGVKPPPSLNNIFQEIRNDLGLPVPKHGCLKYWAEQGVLLLNDCLTVEDGKAHSHANLGWQKFTDRVIASLNEHPQDIVFLLWGSHAQKKIEIINAVRHSVLKAPHPSPLSAHRGFLGCRHFSKANAILEQKGRTPVDWSLPLVDKI